jgi:crotonobetainyl-CoA:carnitine CoA-transferase CaiB-like acyl-CoA transferase
VTGPLDALEGLRVLDLSDGISAAYCAKLLSDAGARVLKVEPPTGHPLRRWSASGAVGRDGDPDGALFRHLASGHESVIVDLDDPAGQAVTLELAAQSDVVIESYAPGHLAALGLGHEHLREVHSPLTMVSISPFGQQGPRAGHERGEFLLQAIVGSLDLHGGVEGPPLAVGGRLGEWAAGAYAAAGVLAARARIERTGLGEHVDVSVLESLAVTLLCYPTLYASLPGGSHAQTFTMVPGVERCQDGYVGLATITVQQWHDVLAMMGRLDLADDRPEWNDQKVRQEEIDDVIAELSPWLLTHTSAEVVEAAALFRVPAAPISTGASIVHLPHLVARALFQPNPRGGFPDPRPPFRTNRTAPRPLVPAPRLGEHGASSRHPGRQPTPIEMQGASRGGLPLEGVRVIDLTAFWAGPFATQGLGTLGADVIKVESVQRPDPMRFSVTVPATTEQWYEQGSLFLSVNLNKRGITLDLSQPEGRELLLRLVATADIVVENFTPRVMEHFGLTYDELRARRADLIMLRMPGWGLEGPWRDRPAFASTMEQASGMAWITGRPDGPPVLPGICDPLAGAHAAFAVLAALEQRRRTGQGQQIELSMLDLSVNVAIEQVIEYAAYGHLTTREGNRGPTACPQGVYACSGDRAWLAVAVGTDAQWQALCEAVDSPALANDPTLAHAQGRRAAHDRLDKELAAWCAPRALDAALGALQSAGVPAEPVAAPYGIDEDEQLLARGFWEEVDHPVVGPQRYPGWPMRLSGSAGDWYRLPAPLLGQHTEEILRDELGLGAEDLARLREAHVIGDRLLRQ